MNTKSTHFPLSHPALLRFFLLTEYHITEQMLEEMSGKSLKELLIIMKGLDIRQRLEQKEAEMGVK